METLTSTASRDAYAAGRDLNIQIDTLPIHFEPQDATVEPHQYDRDRPVFLQYLNPEIRACYGMRSKPTYTGRQLDQVLHATKLAVLATDEHLIFPASYFYEVPAISLYLRRIAPLVELGIVQYSSHISNIEEYADHKASEYREDGDNPYLGGGRDSIVDGVLWRPRYSATTAIDISGSWQNAISGGELTLTIQNLARGWPRKAGHLETVMGEVPTRLEGQAFVARYVRNIVPVPFSPVDVTRLNMFLSRAYIASYLTDLNATIVANFTFGDLSCGTGMLSEELGRRVLSAQRFDRSLKWLRLYDFVHRRASWGDLVALRSTPEFGLLFAALVDPNQATALARAVSRAKRRTRSDVVGTLDEAFLVIEVTAAELEAGRRLQLRTEN
ncbi:hypothetical protein [Kribbella sp.]|uniref:hypothetical protein n=1 Tax=Kribbella sp. TaxID=1871183 RepID=UPI002D77F35D|nr:hypothetical protein [Kribbella sp.]